MNRAFGGYICGKKVMVTGHTGFKGSLLSIWLRELGAEVTGYSLPPKTGRIVNAENKILGLALTDA